MTISQSNSISGLEWFSDLTSTHDVVGASIAVLRNGATATACWGHARHDSGHAVGADTVFQIGSITKVYTATQALQLVESGQVDLDDPIGQHIPDLRRVNPPVAEAITLRHLLTHTSGLDSNYVPDTGRGDDCLALLIEQCAGLTQLAEPGASYAYCNVGFVLLGRVIELTTGLVWDAALHKTILEPASLHETMTLPETVLLHPAAVGHFPTPTEQGTIWRQPDTWSVHRAAGPAGTICATPRDVVQFARHFIGGGDTQLLDPALRNAMTTPHVLIAGSDGGESGCGLGWHTRTLNGRNLIGHTGGNMGQGGHLWIDLDTHDAVCILVNGLASDSYLDDVTAAALPDSAR